MNRPHILLACNGNFLAHVSRVLMIGDELRKRGAKVTYAGSGPYVNDLLLDRQAPVMPLWTEPKAATMAFARGDDFPYSEYITNVCQAFNCDIQLAKRLAPDVIVSDFRWTMQSAAKELAIPCVSVTNAAWTRFYAPPMDGWTAEATIAKREEIGLYWGAPYGNVSLWDVIAGDLTLIADLPAFAPLLPNAPASMQYIGPMLFRGECSWPAWRLMVDDSKPMIYVTMGSSGDDVTFGRILMALADQEQYNVFITAHQDGRLPNVPNFYYADRLPGLKACSDASVVICHGGNGTIYQAIAGNTPLIVLPNTVEQRVHAQRVRDLGIGVYMDEDFSDRQLGSCIHDMIKYSPHLESLWEIRNGLDPHPEAAQMLAADAILKLAYGR